MQNQSYILGWDFLQTGIYHPDSQHAVIEEQRSVWNSNKICSTDIKVGIPCLTSRKILSEILVLATPAKLGCSPVQHITISTKGIMANLGWTTSGKHYKQLWNGLDQLRNISISSPGKMNIPDGLIRYQRKQNNIILTLTDHFFDYLHTMGKQAKRYAKVPIQIERQLTTYQSYRLFEYLISIDLLLKKNRNKVGTQTIRATLGITPKAQPAYVRKQVHKAIDKTNKSYGYIRYNAWFAKNTLFIAQNEKYEIIGEGEYISERILQILPPEAQKDIGLRDQIRATVSTHGEELTLLLLNKFNFKKSQNPGGLFYREFKNKIREVIRDHKKHKNRTSCSSHKNHDAYQEVTKKINAANEFYFDSKGHSISPKLKKWDKSYPRIVPYEDVDTFNRKVAPEQLFKKANPYFLQEVESCRLAGKYFKTFDKWTNSVLYEWATIIHGANEITKNEQFIERILSASKVTDITAAVKSGNELSLFYNVFVERIVTHPAITDENKEQLIEDIATLLSSSSSNKEKPELTNLVHNEEQYKKIFSEFTAKEDLMKFVREVEDSVENIPNAFMRSFLEHYNRMSH